MNNIKVISFFIFLSFATSPKSNLLVEDNGTSKADGLVEHKMCNNRVTERYFLDENQNQNYQASLPDEITANLCSSNYHPNML